LGAGEAVESIADELEATAKVDIGLISNLRPDVLVAGEAVEAKIDELEAATTEESVSV
jgi:hypothetical protein